MSFFLALFLFTNWVVLDAATDTRGTVQSVEILHGVDRFDAIALPTSNPLPADSRVTFIFLFRPRALFSASPIQLVPSLKRQSDRAAVPVELSDPGYPVNSVGEGSVVLELQIASTGAVQGVRVISDAPGLAAHTERATRSWKFEPAVRNGSATAGAVIVVASYLRPEIQSGYIPNNPPPPPVITPPSAVFREKPRTTPPF